MAYLNIPICLSAPGAPKHKQTWPNLTYNLLPTAYAFRSNVSIYVYALLLHCSNVSIYLSAPKRTDKFIYAA